MIKLSELQIKEVIVIEDGSRLGHISDLDINDKTGRITALIIMIKEKKAGLFGKPGEIIIPWSHIQTIGSDVVLVKGVETPPLYSEQPFIE